MAKIPCSQCDKAFKNRSGLDWHLAHIHGVQSAGEGPSPVEDESLSKPNPEQPETDSDTISRVQDLERRLVEIEKVVVVTTGTRDEAERPSEQLDELAGMLGDTREEKERWARWWRGEGWDEDSEES